MGTCCKSTHIKVAGKLCDRVAGCCDIFFILLEKISFFLVRRLQSGSYITAFFGELFEC